MEQIKWQLNLQYGPSYSSGIPQHQYLRIRNIVQQLRFLNFNVKVLKTNKLNRFIIQLYDKEIFVCDIRNLKFNMSMEDDLVAQRAVDAVLDAKKDIEHHMEQIRVKNAKCHFKNEDIHLFYEVVVKENPKVIFSNVISRDSNTVEGSSESKEIQVTEPDHILGENKGEKEMMGEVFRLYRPNMYPSISTTTNTFDLFANKLEK